MLQVHQLGHRRMSPLKMSRSGFFLELKCMFSTLEECAQNIGMVISPQKLRRGGIMTL